VGGCKMFKWILKLFLYLIFFGNVFSFLVLLTIDLLEGDTNSSHTLFYYATYVFLLIIIEHILVTNKYLDARANFLLCKYQNRITSVFSFLAICSYIFLFIMDVNFDMSNDIFYYKIIAAYLYGISLLLIGIIESKGYRDLFN